jgi:hypothetical protein
MRRRRIAAPRDHMLAKLNIFVCGTSDRAPWRFA